MATVMIKCPMTSHCISTGMEVGSDEEFSFLLDVAYHADCPLCGYNHVWFKHDAWVMDSAEGRQTEMPAGSIGGSVRNPTKIGMPLRK
jgi:hypothetical protein